MPQRPLVDPTPSVPDPVLDPILDLIASRYGLRCDGTPRRRVEATVRAHAHSLGVDLATLHRQLARGEAHDGLVDRLVVGESYFFREPQHLRIVANQVVPQEAPRIASPSRPLRVWSAGCAGGEEAFSLAIVLDATTGPRSYRILGTDVSRAAVRKADAATFGPWALRALTSERRDEYFVSDGDRFAVRDRYRQQVRFAQGNLLDGPPPQGPFDVVFCRNVLIHLTATAIERVAKVLTGALAPGGWLITGLSDPPLTVEGLERVRTGDGFAYCRRAGSSTAAGAHRARPHAEGAIPTPKVASKVRTAVATHRQRPKTSTSAPAPPTAHAAAPQSPAGGDTPGRAHEQADLVRRLGDAGLLQEAASVVDGAIDEHPSDPELRFLAATILLAAGCPDDALIAAEAAVEVGPDLAATHLLLARIEHQVGRDAEARRSMQRARRLLVELPLSDEVAMTGESAASLLALVGPDDGSTP